MSEEKKVLVVALVSMAGHDFNLNPGQKFFVGENEAERLIAVGHCCLPENYDRGGAVVDITRRPGPQIVPDVTVPGETGTPTTPAPAPGNNSEASRDDSEVGALGIPPEDTETKVKKKK